MTFPNRIGLVLAAFVMLAGTSSLAQLPIQDLHLFNTVPLPKTSTNRLDEALAIDGNTDTFSYLTPSYSIGQRFVGLDLGSSANINRLQVNKASANVDGYQGFADPMDLQLLYTTDSGPIRDRHYQPVTGLTNGYLGSELITGSVGFSVNNANATVVAESHEGIYSLSFNNVSATGLALGISRNAAGDAPFIHYPTFEFNPMDGTTPHAAAAIDIFREAIPIGGLSADRWDFGKNGYDQRDSIDGDLNTFSYLTMSFTDHPVAAALDLGSATAVNRIRVAKVTNQVTGSGIVEPMNVQILYTTDTGPLNERTYQPVSGLTNGFNGTELIKADAVDSTTAIVLGEIHQFSTDGWFSLMFSEVNATAIAYGIVKPDGSANPYINYPVWEFQLYDSAVVGIAGDYNNNGVVDAADYVLWRKGGPLQNEVNTPGTVDASDYDAWRARFGNTAGGSGSLDGGAVPEPSLSLLALLAIATTAVVGRGRRSSPGPADCNR
jgi:hypothetical protein